MHPARAAERSSTGYATLLLLRCLLQQGILFYLAGPERVPKSALAVDLITDLRVGRLCFRGAVKRQDAYRRLATLSRKRKREWTFRSRDESRSRPYPSNRTTALLLTGKRILVDNSIFHDDLEIVGGVGNKADIVEGISVDEQQIRECALFHDAELAGIRIPLAR